MRAVFMGTPEAAVGCLEATATWAGECAVYTQPDRPRGRSKAPRPSPVKERAEALGLPVRQPERLRGNEAELEWLRAFGPEVIVVVAFAQILPPEVLAVPRLGCVNVHFSLLPKYRGAAPVQRAIMAGETITGISTMHMDAGLDTGPVLLTESVAIEPWETAGELMFRLAERAPQLLRATLEGLLRGSIIGAPQDASAASLAPRLSAADGRIGWDRPAAEIVQRIRGVTPWPGAKAEVGGEELRILRARVGEGSAAPGTVLAARAGDGILVAAADGAVWLVEVQAPGRRPVPGEAYARGRQDWALPREAGSKES